MIAQIAEVAEMPVNAKTKQKNHWFSMLGYIFDKKDNSMFKVLGCFNIEITHHEDFSEVLLYWGNSTYGYVDSISVAVTDFENRATYFYKLISENEAKF